MGCDEREFTDLLTILSTPRPNGSRALARVVGQVRDWLEAHDIPVRHHSFRLRPYFMELLGLWLAAVGLLIPIAVAGGWRWGGLALVLLALGVPVLELRFLVPVVTWLIRVPADNLVVTIPVKAATQEVILCGHLDSKTELLDHYQRSLLLRFGPLAMGVGLVCGVLMVVDGIVTGSDLVRWGAFAAALPVAGYGLGMGANLIGGRFSRRPSTGAVDDGAAVMILMMFARALRQGKVGLDRTTVTLLFTVGEEAQMQGAAAYAEDRGDWLHPTHVINLEVLGQSGGYLLWERDGTAMLSLPIDSRLNCALERAVEEVTGALPAKIPQISSDGFAFLRRGIPAATLGSFDAESGGRGLHSAQDSPSRVDAARVVEALRILVCLILTLDGSQESFDG